MRSFRKRLMVSLLTLGLVAGGGIAALAGTTPSHAFHTALTLTQPGPNTQAAGTDVRLKGNLSTGKNRCKSNQSVEIDRDGVVVGTATTNGTGHYTYTDSGLAAGTYAYQARFAGSTFGSTGQNSCRASQSRTVQVTISS